MTTRQLSIKQIHGKNAMLYALSRLFERAGYYGVRMILVLYLVEGIGESYIDALSFFGFFATSIYLLKVLGGVLGDLAIGNRLTMIIGGGFQIMGAKVFCFPSMVFVYIGAGMIALGTGLYDPNVLAQFGKEYIHKPRIMDSGYGIFYIGINVGAFIGAFMSILVIDDNYSGGLALSALFFVVATLISVFIKPKTSKTAETIESVGMVEIIDRIEAVEVNDEVASKRKRYGVLVFLAMLMSSVFWMLYEISGLDMVMIVRDIVIIPIDGVYILPSVITSNINYGTVLILGGLFSLFWYYRYSAPLLKLAIGFVLAGISYLVMIQVPVVAEGNNFAVFFIATVLLGVAEFFVIPPILSLLTLHSNTKYLALVMAGFGLFTAMSMKLTAYVYGFLEAYQSIPYFGLYLGVVILPVFGGGLYVVYRVLKEKTAVFNSGKDDFLDVV